MPRLETVQRPVGGNGPTAGRMRFFSQSWRQKISRAAVQRALLQPETIHSFRKGQKKGTAGYRADLGGKWFRSMWEANYARYLTFVGIAWEYEPKTFWFEKIRRGVRSYTPDFFLPRENVYHEIKGYMDQRSRTKLKRMQIYYPGIRVLVIGGEFFKAANKQGLCRLVPHWECRHEKHQVNYIPYKFSTERRAQHSQLLTGRTFSPEHRANLSIAARNRRSTQ